MGEKKVIRDGKVAVLVSPGHGAGWSSWAGGEAPASELLFDPELVALVEKKARLHDEGRDAPAWREAIREAEEYAAKKWPQVYTGGVAKLRIEWVPVGTSFRIDEYDGSESLVSSGSEEWITA